MAPDIERLRALEDENTRQSEESAHLLEELRRTRGRIRERINTPDNKSRNPQNGNHAAQAG